MGSFARTASSRYMACWVKLYSRRETLESVMTVASVPAASAFLLI
jgi:hypothetical protein